MMNLLMWMSGEGDGERLARHLDGHGELTVRVAAPVMESLTDVLDGDPVDVVIADPPQMDRCLAVRRARALVAAPEFRLVLADPSPTVPRLVRASQYGFDGVVDPTMPPVSLMAHLRDIVHGSGSVHVHPLLSPLDVVPGLFTRRIKYGNHDERDMVELMSLGLSDRDIATALDLSIQTVRNAVSRLLVEHGLSNRTQLASLYIRGEETGATT